MPEAGPSLAIGAKVDAEFRKNLMVLSAPPTRFYLNLIETCNLRCAHCITLAPDRTSIGTGRAMPMEVLDALTQHLEHASYIGLTHAGEPITSPSLVPLLERLSRARKGLPTVVHVLTNGLALTERRFIELTELGVSSWSFSVDGMSASTHDVIRAARDAAIVLKVGAEEMAREAEGDRAVKVTLDIESIRDAKVAWRGGLFRIEAAKDPAVALKSGLEWIARIGGRDILFRWLGENAMPLLLDPTPRSGPGADPHAHGGEHGGGKPHLAPAPPPSPLVPAPKR